MLNEYYFVIATTLISVCILTYLFYVAPFRQTQVALVYMVFSFQIRPIASGLCDNFRSFYYFSENLYVEGVIYSSIVVTCVALICMVSYRPNAKIVSVDVPSLRNLTNILLILSTATVFFALLIYGTSILPGFRTAGLSKSAPGSQIFFAFTSVFAMFGVSLISFLFLTKNSSLKYSLCVFVVFFLLVMVFNQRGALIGGIFIGMFLSGMVNRKYIFKDIKSKISLIVALLIIAAYGRAIIYNVVDVFTKVDSIEYVSHVESQSLFCKISSKPNQEHDQVWPVLFKYEQEHGNDFYRNLLSSVFRSFLSADERMDNNLMTAVDTLNIYNDRSTYLGKNFGFSIPGMLYQYYSVGIVFFITLPIIYILSTFYENRIKIVRLNAQTFFKIVLLNQFVVFFTNAWDERLKWLIISVLAMYLVCYPINYAYCRWIVKNDQ
ncbi:hypothetical protein ACI1IE_002116 [Vibrio vulnificus]